MADDLSQTIKQTAEGPAAVNIDGNSVTAQDPLKQIAVDKHLASKSAVAQKHRGLRFAAEPDDHVCIRDHGRRLATVSRR